MKTGDVMRELELSVRSFLEARERAGTEALDDFDELRILEAAFNRLFVAVEHLCNALVLFETGNYSKNHFGDLVRLRTLAGKYQTDLAQLYETTYTFRSYADYRKFPHLEKRFTRPELKRLVGGAESALLACLQAIGMSVDVTMLSKRLQKT